MSGCIEGPALRRLRDGVARNGDRRSGRRLRCDGRSSGRPYPRRTSGRWPPTSPGRSPTGARTAQPSGGCPGRCRRDRTQRGDRAPRTTCRASPTGRHAPARPRGLRPAPKRSPGAGLPRGHRGSRADCRCAGCARRCSRQRPRRRAGIRRRRSARDPQGRQQRACFQMRVHRPDVRSVVHAPRLPVRIRWRLRR